jgi:N-acetylglucosamine-6-sulfatase
MEDRRRALARPKHLPMCRLLAVLLVLLCAACTPREEPRPNILFVLTDDLNTRLLRYLPELQAMLPARGMALEMTVPTPVCVPSRASILAARYAHNTGVTRNGPRGGGVWHFDKSGGSANTFAVWLHDVGYRTGFFGKYLNEHEQAGATVPPGWDRWSSYGKVTLSRTGFTVIEDGGKQRKIDAAYDTDFFAAEAVRWLETVPEPFLAVWTPMAPHGPFVSPARHRGKFANVDLEWAPSFSADEAEVAKLTRTRLELMLGVQDGLRAMLAALEKRGLLDRTWIFFTSDHGLFMGEHGFAAGKGEFYEETTRVPLFVRGPGVPAGSGSDALITSTDLGPTFAAIGGAKVPADVDGRSFLPVLEGKQLPEPRRRVLLEWWDPDMTNPWLAIRTPDQKLVRFKDGRCTRFALHDDPYEMNGTDCDPETAAQVSAQIDRLRSCAGAACAAAERE